MPKKNLLCVGSLFLILGFLISGCGTFFRNTDEPMHTYVLHAEIPTESQPVKRETGTLLVNVPRAQSGFNTQRMAYVKQDHELNYFAVNQWAEPPAYMLLPLLVKALENTHQWGAVVQMPSPVRGDYQLVPENMLLQQEFTQEPSRVRMHLRLQLIRVKNFHVLATREFTVLENAKSDDPYGGVQAANTATGILLKEISEWVSLCMVEPTEKKC
jgi:cholesterol transport system auxiliary component